MPVCVCRGSYRFRLIDPGQWAMASWVRRSRFLAGVCARAGCYGNTKLVGFSGGPFALPQELLTC